MDIADIAADVAEAERQFLVDGRPRLVLSRPSRLTCARCEDDIPKARRLASPGCEFCVPCLEIMERLGR